MSHTEFEICVYLREINEDLWPTIINGLNRFDMKCRIMKQKVQLHPNFITFSFTFDGNKSLLLKDEIISGFYFFVNRFDYKTEKDNFRFSDDRFKKHLKTSCYKLVFKWTPENIFSLRFAFLASAILAERFKGVCHYPPKNLWHDGIGVVNTAWKEVQDFEKFVLPNLFQNIRPCNYTDGEPWKEADLTMVISLN